MNQENDQTLRMNMHQHFLLVPFPAQGHINPVLQLAKNLARCGAKVTFATTIRGLNRISDLLPTIKGLSYASFSDGHDQEDVDTDFFEYMSDLSRHGSENLTNLVKAFRDDGTPVTCLVYSLLVPWVAAVARAMHMPSAFLSIQCAAAFTIYQRFFNSCDGIIDGIHTSSSISVNVSSGLPFFSFIDLPTFLLPEDKLNSFMIPMMRQHWKELEKDPQSYVFLNTFHELEKEAIKALENKLINVIPIGPLLPSAFSDGCDSTDRSFGADFFVKSNGCLQWLDSKPQERSVIYVSFGSLVPINREQKVEIFHALMESKTPFLWVLRSLDSEDDDMKKLLENVRNGLIVKWCSQVEVLSHKSIGCFVTHCGWNSTLESLTCGVPIIGVPHFSDQTTNAKLLEEVWGTGIRAKANGETMVTREELKKYLEIVMGESDRGNEIRNNAWKWRGLAIEAVREGGSTYNNMKKILSLQLGFKFVY